MYCRVRPRQLAKSQAQDSSDAECQQGSGQMFIILQSQAQTAGEESSKGFYRCRMLAGFRIDVQRIAESGLDNWRRVKQRLLQVQNVSRFQDRCLVYCRVRPRQLAKSQAKASTGAECQQGSGQMFSVLQSQAQTAGEESSKGFYRCRMLAGFRIDVQCIAESGLESSTGFFRCRMLEGFRADVQQRQDRCLAQSRQFFSRDRKDFQQFSAYMFSESGQKLQRIRGERL